MNAKGIQAIADLAKTNPITLLDKPPLYIQNGDKVTFLEALQPKRSEPRGYFKTDRVKALASYVKNRNTVEHQVDVYVDPSNMSAKVFFDNFNGTEQGHGKDTAFCQLSKTAAFAGLLVTHGNRVSQQSLVSWLIDWSSNVVGAAQIITAVRSIKVTTNKEVKSSVNQMNRELSAMEKVEAQATGENALPETIFFYCEPYLGFGPEQFSISVQAITEDDAINFLLRIEQYEAKIEGISDRFALIIAESLGITPEVGVFTN